MFSNQLTIGWECTLQNPVHGVHLDADIQAAGTQPHASCSAPAPPRRGSCTGRGVGGMTALITQPVATALRCRRCTRPLEDVDEPPPLAAFAPCCSAPPQPPRPLAASAPCRSMPPQPLHPWGRRAFAAKGHRTPSCSGLLLFRRSRHRDDLDPGGVGRRGDDETRM